MNTSRTTTRSHLSTARRMLRRAMIATLAATAVLPGVAAAEENIPVEAQATTTTIVQGQYSGWGYGANLTLDGSSRAAAQRVMDVAGREVVTYCVQYGVSFNSSPGVIFTGVSRSASGIANIAKVADIAARSTSIGSTLIGTGATAAENETMRSYEAAAVQLAIWKYTDNLNLDQVTNTTVRNRAIELYNLAQSSTESGPDLEVVSGYSGSAGNRRLNVTVRSSGVAISGATVSVSGGVSGTITTGADGRGSLAIGDSALSVNLSTSRVVPAGVVLVPTSGQKVITAGTSTVSASGVLSIPAAVVTTQPPTTQPPVTTAPVTPAPGTSRPPNTTVPAETAVTTPTSGSTTTVSTVDTTTTTLVTDDPLQGVVRDPNSSGNGKWFIALLVLLLVAFLIFLAVRIFGAEDEDDPYRH